MFHFGLVLDWNFAAKIAILAVSISLMIYRRKRG